MGEFKWIEGREAKSWEGKEKREIESWEEIQAERRRVRNRTKNTGKRRLNGDVLENRRKKILNENCFTLISYWPKKMNELKLNSSTFEIDVYVLRPILTTSTATMPKNIRNKKNTTK